MHCTPGLSDYIVVLVLLKLTWITWVAVAKQFIRLSKYLLTCSIYLNLHKLKLNIFCLYTSAWSCVRRNYRNRLQMFNEDWDKYYTVGFLDQIARTRSFINCWQYFRELVKNKILRPVLFLSIKSFSFRYWRKYALSSHYHYQIYHAPRLWDPHWLIQSLPQDQDWRLKDAITSNNKY